MDLSWENPAAPFDSNDEEAFGRAHTAERSPALAGEKEERTEGRRGKKERERALKQNRPLPAE